MKEYFQPFSNDIVECSIIIEEKCFVNYVKKVLKLTNKIKHSKIEAVCLLN